MSAQTTAAPAIIKKPARAKQAAKAETVDNLDWQLTKTRPHVLAAVIRPTTFDPMVKSHREAFAHFLVNKKWPDSVRFIEEHPFTSAVTTAQQKMVEYALRNEITAVLATQKALKNASTKLTKESK
jgi:hypothetical protein